ncbi:MAG: hypothetical protein ACJ8G3_20030, partial [Burkholderiaceae bacterium]
RVVGTRSGARLNSLRCASLRQTPHLIRSGHRRHGALNGDLNGNGNGQGHFNGNGNGHFKSNCNCNCNCYCYCYCRWRSACSENLP